MDELELQEGSNRRLPPEVDGKWHFYLQLGFILIAWLFLFQLHWHNDGLWMQGDAPRHATNGIFWKDFLLSGSVDPLHYALQYYARYPAISPTNYPPLFYWVEALAFGILHVSPHIAKGLVLLFALLAALYLMAWIRRWIGVDTAWIGGLVLFMPGFVVWSHAVMLNVPSTALSLAALYHARRWIEAAAGSGESAKHLYLSAAFSAFATITYFPAGVVIVVIAVWLVVLRRWSLMVERKTILAGLTGALFIAPWLFVAFRWAPLHVSFVTESFQWVTITSGLRYYLKALPELAGPFLLVVAGIGLASGLANRTWRREILFMGTLLLSSDLVFSGLVARESRYALLFCAPLLCFCAIAFRVMHERLFGIRRSRPGFARIATLAIAVAVASTQAWMAAITPVPEVRGIKDVVVFLEHYASNEPVFYDGRYDGVFTFYFRSRDPGYQRRIVLGNKLLYASALDPGRNYQSYASSVPEVLQLLQKRGGCRLIVVERGPISAIVRGGRLLRKTVQGPQFELIRSFPISGYGITRIDLYRFKLAVDPVEEVELPFPILGQGVNFKVRPIRR
jgi:hypothetical protein